MRFRVWSGVIACVLLVCLGQTHAALHRSAASIRNRQTPAPQTSAWSYKNGGSDWGSNCTGPNQSPVDINLPEGKGGMDSLELKVYYPIVSAWEVGLKVKHTGKALSLMANNHRALGFATFNNRRYYVKNIYFRSPSEHTIRGEQFAMEMQIVHQRAGAAEKSQDDLYIISALFRQSNTSNAFLEKRIGWNTLPRTKGSRQLLDGPFRLGESIVGLHQGYYQYYGSATIPPCTVGAVWNVMESIQDISSAQVQQIQYFFGGNVAFAVGRGNNRDVQSLGERSIVLHNHRQRGDGDDMPPGRPDSFLHADHRKLDASLESDPEGPNGKPLPADRPETVPKKYWYGGDDWTGRCRYGRTQSPINIVISNGNPHGDYKFESAYDQITGVLIENTGELFKLIGNFGRIMIDKLIYDAYEITFHSPAEHMIDGRHPHMEMQIFHKRRKPDNRRLADPRDDFVVVSVLFVESTSTPSKFLDTLGWDSLPGKGLTREVKDKVNLYHIQGMENNAGGYYSYAGSLSRPPCAEGVRRFVMRQYQDISTIQLSRMRVYYNGNNRKVQPLNGRGVQLQNINAHTDMFNMEPKEILADGTILPTVSE